jgi:hypothetical protein
MRLIASLVAASCIASAVHAQPVGTWTRLSAGGGPNAVSFRGMMFDSNRGVLVAWDALNRWEWRGNSWIVTGGSLALTEPLQFPPQLMRQGFAFDPESNRLARAYVPGYSNLFRGFIDGFDCSQAFQLVFGPNTTQFLDLGNDWNLVVERVSVSVAIDPTTGDGMLHLPMGQYSGSASNPANGYRFNLRSSPSGPLTPFGSSNFPAARARSAIAFDRMLSEYVLFGGLVFDPVTQAYSGNSVVTWAYGSNDWRPAEFSGPAPRYSHSMVFDASRGRTILFGGITNGASSAIDGFAWEWDGVTWIRGSSGPIPRFNAAMVYDSANSRVLLFGGSPVAEPGAALSDLWEYKVASAPRIQSQPRRIVALEGEPVRMEMVLAPDATLRQPLWRRQGVAMTDAPGYVGSQSRTLMISSVAFSDAGAYEFLISNDAGRAISDPVFVEVLCRVDADRSGFLDSDDFIAYVTAFERGCVSVGFGAELPDPDCKARADYDYSGFVDSDDFIQYIEAFNNGC